MFAANFLLQLLYFAGEEFHRTTALGTDHVMMAAPVVLVLIARDAVMELDLAGQSAFGEKFQRAVNGGIPNAGVLLLNQAMKFVGGEMVAGLKKRAQDGVALRCLLQANAFEMAVENLLRFAHHLARDRRLVIDALLQHEMSA